MMDSLQLLYSNTTPAALIEGLNDSSHSACLCEDEGVSFFKSKIIEDFGLLNKAWGGDRIVVNRMNKRISIPSPRSTLAVLIQNVVFEKFMRNRGDEARGIGFLARCLISYPESTQGDRLRRYRPADLPEIDRFNTRSLELFNEQAPLFNSKTIKTRRIKLTFKPLAQAEWNNIYDCIERSCRAGGAFFRNRDYASKMAENIARMAAIFHAFEGSEGTRISHDHLESAARIVFWYANEFLRLFTPPSPIEIMVNNARMLDAWLINYVRSTGIFCLPKSYLLTSGPNSLRKAAILDEAVQRLISTNRATYILGTPIYSAPQKKKGTMMLLLQDHYYGQIARGNRPFNISPL